MHPLKASSPIEVIVEGRLTALNDSQSLKVSLSIEQMKKGIFIFFILIQPRKAPSSMRVIESIFMRSSDEQ